jgi:hypothetical protein
MFHYVLIIDLFHVEDGFRDIISLNPKVNIILIISGLPEFLIGYNVGMKTGNISHIL